MSQPSPLAKGSGKKTKGKRASIDHVQPPPTSSSSPSSTVSAHTKESTPAKRAKHVDATSAIVSPLDASGQKKKRKGKKQKKDEEEPVTDLSPLSAPSPHFTNDTTQVSVQHETAGEEGEMEEETDHEVFAGQGEFSSADDTAITSTTATATVTTAKNKKERVDVKALSSEELEAYKQAQARRGVIYISRVPPFMRPVKLRHMLSQYGEVDRIWLRPEDDSARKRRLQKGGSRKRNYCEGWVEFLDKKMARRVAESLNATPIGGKKGSFHYDDLWTLKYLPKFKWHNLTERVAYDRAVREKRIQAEMQQVQKESLLYVEQATKAQR
jgi:ESF2/ABP1 family protein